MYESVEPCQVAFREREKRGSSDEFRVGRRQLVQVRLIARRWQQDKQHHSSPTSHRTLMSWIYRCGVPASGTLGYTIMVPRE